MPHLQDVQVILAVLTHAHLNNLTANQSQQILQEEHNIKRSIRCLRRYIKKYGFKKNDQGPDPGAVAEAIKKHFYLGETNKMIILSLRTEHNITMGERTLRRRLKRMGLNRRVDDIDSNRFSYNDIRHIIEQIRAKNNENAGFRVFKEILSREHHIHIHRRKIQTILYQIDPEGVERRRRGVLVRRRFRCPGPDHIWSADGHDKLQKWGIRIYGFIDAWSRRILGLFVHVTNHNPRHINLYYLEMIRKCGGFPQYLHTDRGTETGDMAATHASLHHFFADLEEVEALTRHKYTKSVHNQKIECFWSQLMRRHNRGVVERLFKAMEEGDYNPDNELDHLLFLYLWIPFMQKELAKFTNRYNNFPRRKDNHTVLPSGTAADWAYKHPDEFGNAQSGLVPVAKDTIDQIIAHDYPGEDIQDLFSYTPSWFSEVADGLMVGLNLDHDKLQYRNIWACFRRMRLNLLEADWTNTPFADIQLV